MSGLRSLSGFFLIGLELEAKPTVVELTVAIWAH